MGSMVGAPSMWNMTVAPTFQLIMLNNQLVYHNFMNGIKTIILDLELQ